MEYIDLFTASFDCTYSTDGLINVLYWIFFLLAGRANDDSYQFANRKNNAVPH